MGVPQARPVQVHPETVPVGERADLRDVRCGEHEAAARVVGVLQRDHPGDRVVGLLVGLHERLDRLERERAVVGVEPAQLHARQRRRPAHLVDREVAALVAHDLVGRPAARADRDLVAHRPGRHP